MYTKRNSFLSLLLLLATALLIQTCAVNPVTGKREFSIISESQEIQMGEQYDPQVVAEFGVYEDQAIQQFLSQKGQAMARVSERPELPWTFKLLDSPVVNAFAVPGGKVYFTRGIMAHFNNEAQFAGVLGHEIGHVTARHSVQQQSKAVLYQGLLIGGMIAVPELASMGESAMQGLQLLFLKFGRDAESQSDELGVKYSTKIGYDAKEMAGFFGTLNRLSGGPEGRLPTFMSTHPDPADRQVRVGQLATAAQQQSPQNNFDVGRNSYLRMIDGIVYGEDPKQGYTEDGVFYHPELKFQYPVPNGYRVANSPQQVQMAPQDGKAVLILRLAQGSSAQAAASEFVQQNNVQLVSNNAQRINGLDAYAIFGDVVPQAQEGQTTQQQSQPIRVLAAFIEMDGNIYQLMGLSLKTDFNTYQRDFEFSISNFKRVTDASKLNRQPERIRIYTVPNSTTLQGALQSAGMPSDRHEELAILNGMNLTDRLPSGTLIKVIDNPN